MNNSRGVIRFGACATAICAGLSAILGIGSDRLAPVAPSTAAHAATTTVVPVAFHSGAAEHDYTATVKVSAGQNGKAKKLLGTGTFAVPAGHIDAGLQIGTNYRVEVLIDTDESHQTAQHSVQMELIHYGNKKDPVMAPRVMMADGGTCIVSTDDGEGNDVQLEVSVEQSDRLQ